MSKSDEKRRHPRTPASLPVRLSHPSFGIADLTTRDVSEGGLFVLTKPGQRAPKTGDVLSVEVHGLPGGQPLDLEAEVVWVGEEGFGLKILHRAH